MIGDWSTRLVPAQLAVSGVTPESPISRVFPVVLAGGIREAAASVRGDDVYGSLKHENGVHRVSGELRGRHRPLLSVSRLSVFSSARKSFVRCRNLVGFIDANQPED